MEVSSWETVPGGQELIDTVITLTGMPSELMEAEIGRILKTSGQGPEELTLEGLRSAMLAFMETLTPEMFEEGYEESLALRAVPLE
jgi:hypothetical protein